eukprot:sb/3465282/
MILLLLSITPVVMVSSVEPWPTTRYMACFARVIYNAPPRVSRSIITGTLTPVGCMGLCEIYDNCSNVAFNLATSECTECTLYRMSIRRPQQLSSHTSPLYMSAEKKCVKITDNFKNMTMEELVDLTQAVPCVFRRLMERLNEKGFKMYSCLKRYGDRGVKWGECSLVMDTWRLENLGNYTAPWQEEGDISQFTSVRVSLNNELCLTHQPKEGISSDMFETRTGVHLEPCVAAGDPRQVFVIKNYDLYWGTEIFLEGSETDLYSATIKNFSHYEDDIDFFSVKLEGYFIPAHTIPCSTKISKKYGVLESELYGIPNGVSATQKCGGGERREVVCENRTLVGLMRCEEEEKVIPSGMVEVRVFILYILYGLSGAFLVFLAVCTMVATSKGCCGSPSEDKVQDDANN